MTFLTVLVIGFLLGIKHAVEPDHVVAVSTLANENKNLKKASLAGIYWGVGHTATIFLVGMIVVLFKINIPEIVSMSFEFLVGVMITYLGISTIVSHIKHKVHAHTHKHDDDIHTHFHYHETTKGHAHKHQVRSNTKSAVIGFIHGLAGSAAMIVFTMATVDNAAQAAIYVGVFGVGTVLGMMLFTVLLGLPFIFSKKKAGISTTLAYATGAFSTLFGIHYMYNLGVVEGLFSMWF